MVGLDAQGAGGRPGATWGDFIKIADEQPPRAATTMAGLACQVLVDLGRNISGRCITHVPLMHQRCRNFANRRHWEQLGAKPSAKFGKQIAQTSEITQVRLAQSSRS